jgi:hydroxymethylpyrimidine pyrophosphatase-like HAD family hydrolase
MNRLARRLRAALAAVVAFSLIVLSPGLEPARLAAQTFGRTPSVDVSAPAHGLAPLAPQSVALPAAALSIPPVPASARLPEMNRELAAPLAAAARPGASAENSAAAGRDIESVLTGAQDLGRGDVDASNAAAQSVLSPLPAPLAAAAAPESPKKAEVPAAAAPAVGKVVDSEISYRLHKVALSMIYSLTGALYSAPIAGPALTQKWIERAATREVAFLDFDDTLAPYNELLPEDMVTRFRSIKEAGKVFTVISDRTDAPAAHQKTVFESLATLPPDLADGMYVAAQSGGRVYRFYRTDAPLDRAQTVEMRELPSGETQRIVLAGGGEWRQEFEVENLTGERRKKVEAAIASTKARLHEVGAAQHQPDEIIKDPSESWGPFQYAMMLKVGSDKTVVLGAARIFQEELHAQGLNVEVSSRFAKDPARPPYILFTVATKDQSSAYIASRLGVSARSIAIVGDNWYEPKQPQSPSWLVRLGEKLSGRAIAATGNKTDRMMEAGVPGALSFSVGLTGDPRVKKLAVLSKKGPELTARILDAMASQKRVADVAPSEAEISNIVISGLLTVFGTVAVAVVAFAFLGDFFRIAIDAMLNHWHAAGQLGPIGMGLGIFSVSRGSAVPSSQDLRRSSADMPALDVMRDAYYAPALNMARSRAAEEGYLASKVKFSGAAWRAEKGWTLSFFVPPVWNQDRKFPVTYVNISAVRNAAGEVVLNSTDDSASSSATTPADRFAADVKLSPADVIAQWGEGAAGLSLQPRWNGGQDDGLWYVMYDAAGKELRAVSAATGEVRRPNPLGWLKSTAAFLAIVTVVVAAYGGIFWAGTHGPAATDENALPGAPSNVHGWEDLF